MMPITHARIDQFPAAWLTLRPNVDLAFSGPQYDGVQVGDTYRLDHGGRFSHAD